MQKTIADKGFQKLKVVNMRLEIKIYQNPEAELCKDHAQRFARIIYTYDY